ncbi:MAG TPA: BatA and WFA domain-containing protein, partial [Patescibacteria group bacterium]|nr:BatA and WFA domain-containing protein [Patescibacteria group bacterium]
MPGLFFTNVLMLGGLAALSIPVLIHLLLKRRKKRIQFSTIRFFKQQDEQSSRRRKLRNFFLLALRLLIVTLLVLSFARPYMRQSEASAGGQKQRRVVFVLDHSGSMLATGTDGQRWAVAKERIQRVLSELSQDDAAALVECATHASVLSGFAPPATIAQLVRDLPPAYGTSALSDGLREAVRLLSDRRSTSLCSIYVVSDFQKSACRSLSVSPVPQQLELKTLPVGDVFSPNVSITGMTIQSTDGMRPQASLSSFSDEDTSAATLELTVDTVRASSQVVSLKSGAATNLDLVLPSLKPGWHDLKALLRTKDSLELDNIRYGCISVPQPARVLVIEPRTVSHVFEQASFFITAALDPTAGSSNSVPGPFVLTHINPGQLESQLGSGSSDSVWNLVIVPACKDLPVGAGRSLSAFVRSGGGLVLFLGEAMSANRYSAELADLLPA